MHYVRSIALGESSYRMHKSALQRVLAALWELAISILRLLGRTNLRPEMHQFWLSARQASAGTLTRLPAPYRHRPGGGRCALG